MSTLNRYLEYLNEQSNLKAAGSFILKHSKDAAKISFRWGVFYVPATILAWKTANAAFSNATRKCGGIRRSTPGFKVCVAKERIKALEQKIQIARKILSGCNTAKNPELCRQKFELEIEKSKNRIQINKNKIKEILGESQNLQEVLPIIAGVSGVATFIIAGTIVDKALFMAYRSAQALFSSSVRKCGIYKEGARREICMAKIKLAALNKKLQIYNKVLNNCINTRNPEKCRIRVSKKIAKTQRDIQIEKDTITSYTNELMIAKREEEFRKSMKNEK